MRPRPFLLAALVALPFALAAPAPVRAGAALGAATAPGTAAVAAAPAAVTAPLTLAQAIDEALAQAPQLQQAEAKRSEARWQQRRARASFLPQLQLSASHLFAAKFYQMELGDGPGQDLVSLKSPSTEFGVAASVSLFDGLQNVLVLKAARRHVDAADSELGWQRFRLQREVRFAFRQVLAGQLIEQAARQDIDTLLSHKAQVAALRSQGAATDFDVLRVDVQLENAHVSVAEAEDRTVLARRRLAQLMGLRDDDRPLVGELPRPQAELATRVEALSETPQFVRLDLRALARREEAHGALRQAAKNFWLPKLDLAANVSTYVMWDKEIAKGSLYRDFYTVGVRLRWNVFDGLASLAEAGAQEAQRRQVRHARHAAELAQSYALVEGKRDYLLAIKQVHARELNVRRADENLRLAREGLRNGSQNSTDVLDAEQDLFASRAGAIEALLRLEQAAVHLDLALGTAL